MKKLALLFVFVQSLVFANNPVITLNGDSVVELYLNTYYDDPGATAFDAEDGDLSDSIVVTGTYNGSSVGSYVLAYSVTDSDGNETVKNRIINVVQEYREGFEISAATSGLTDENGNGVLDVSDTIRFSITLENTGNSFLGGYFNSYNLVNFNGNNLSLNEFQLGSYDLNVGTTLIYYAEYTISESTADSGGIEFSVTSIANQLTVTSNTLRIPFASTSDEIILDGQISANNNQIKKVADPTDNLDAVNKRYVDQRTLEQTIPGQNIGDLLYWNGQSWQKLSAPQEQSTLRFCEGQLTWGPCAPEVYITHFDSSNSGIGVYGKVLFNGLLYNELGVVYSKTTQSPTVNDSKFLDDEDVYRADNFAIYGNEFDLESTYFVRAYCISDKGVSYSKEVFSFTTGSLGNSQAGDYKKYGDQHWTVENYAGIFYQDGTYIPQVTDATEWANLTTGAWCYYDNDPNKGILYNWYAVMGIHDNDPNTPNKEFAPEGWHVPTDAEWTTLEIYLITNGYNYDGTTTENKIAKAMASTTGWNSSTNTGAPGNDQSLNNISGFNALPEGKRHIDGWFSGEGNEVVFWSTTESTPPAGVWERGLFNWANQLNRIYRDDNTGSSTGPKRHGFSVRLVKD